MTTTAPTPEELARTAWASIVKEMDAGPYGFEAEEAIAAAISQHSEALERQIAELTIRLEEVSGARLLLDAELAECEDGRAEDRRERDEALARATTAEAALAAMTADRDIWERQASNRVDDALDAYGRAEKAEAALTASQAQETAMREALEREASWNEAEAKVCDRQVAAFKRERNAEGREMHSRCDAAADAHRKAARRLSAALQPQEPHHADR